MDRLKDFTFDPINFPLSKVQALTSKLHSRKQHYVVMIDPAISTNTSYEPYSRGHNLDVFLKLNDYKTELRKCLTLMLYLQKVDANTTSFSDRGTSLARLYCIPRLVAS